MKVVDLFSGAGFFSLGFEAAIEYDLIYALDNWDVACQTYKSNFPYVDVDCRNALEVKVEEIPSCDIIIGGPPCQEFSIAKEKQDNHPNRTFDTSLVDWFLRVVEYIKPKYWIMENVPPVIDFIPNNVMKNIYRMCDYGIPQIRRRLFAGFYNEPKKTPINVKFPTVVATEAEGGVIYRGPILGIRLGSCFRRRSLIPEAKLVQTIPLDYVLHGKLIDQYTMIGNAVPPLMAYKFAMAILEPHQKTLRSSLSKAKNSDT